MNNLTTAYNKKSSERTDDLKLTRCLCDASSTIVCYRDYESYTRAKRARITKRCCPVQCVASASVEFAEEGLTAGQLIQLQGGVTKNGNPALLRVFINGSGMVILNVYVAGQYTELPNAPYSYVLYPSGTPGTGTLTVTWSSNCKSC